MFRIIILLLTALLISSCTEKIQWKDYNTTNIEQLTSEGKTVFVEYTASWCITCLVQKEEILDSREIIKLFKDNNVVAVKADWSDWSSNIEKDLKQHNKVGLPMYIIFSEKTDFKPKLLPEDISFKEIKNNI